MVPESIRRIAKRAAPSHMADRARRHERDLRQREGITALAHRMIGPSTFATVARGPVAGLRYPTSRIADVDTPLGKLLGVYEHEIAALFTRPGVGPFIDVGCADGYYAVGMPVANPGMPSYAFDLASSARELCSTMAELNGVAGSVSVGGRFSLSALRHIPHSRALVLIDIEGGEGALLSRGMAKELQTCTVVVEVHEFMAPGTQAALDESFRETHREPRIYRQSPPQEPPEIANWTAPERERALHEFRPSELWWACYEPLD